MDKLEIKIKTVGELPQEVENQIREANHREFGNDSLIYDSPELYILGLLDNTLVTWVGILQRSILINQDHLRIGGVCYLVTEPDYRRNGFGRIMMREAISYLANTLELPFGLLTCRSELEKFYSSFGYKTVNGPTIFCQANENRICKGLTMVIECGNKTWPKGEINLCGLPW